MEETKGNNKTKIFIIGDIHAGKDDVFSVRLKQRDRIIEKVIENPDALVIVTGDLTETGTGTAKCCLFPCLMSNSCGKSDEFGKFKSQFYDPLNNVIKKGNLFVIHGNHDEGNSTYSYPVLDFVREQYNATKDGFYNFQRNGIQFVALGKYPSQAGINYFNQISEATQDALPYVLFFHYNIYGEWSQFWTDAEKNNFLSVIDNKNIVAMFHGHIHVSYQSIIQTIPSQQNIQVFCGSGMDGFMEVNIEDRKVVSYSIIY